MLMHPARAIGLYVTTFISYSGSSKINPNPRTGCSGKAFLLFSDVYWQMQRQTLQLSIPTPSILFTINNFLSNTSFEGSTV
jgi:hypothetical protein